MAEQNDTEIRTVLAHTLYANNNSEGLLGFVKPVAEIVGDKLAAVTPENFCQTMKVFITSGYEELAQRFPFPVLFKLQVNVSERPSENVDPAYACKYVSFHKRAEAVRPKDFFEVIAADLPAPEQRDIYIQTLPGTRFIFVDDGEYVYGPFKWSPKNADEISIDLIDSKLPVVSTGSYQVYKIAREKVNEQAVVYTEGNIKRRFLYDLHVVQGAVLHDYASDEEVLRYIAKQAQDHNIKIIEKSKFDNLASYLAKHPKANSLLVRQRLNRLPQLVAEASETQSIVLEGLGNYLKGEHGRPLIAAYIQENEAQYLDVLIKNNEKALNAQLEGIQSEIKQAEGRVHELNNEKIELSMAVERARLELKKGPALELERDKADKQLAQKRDELAEVERNIAERTALDEALNALDEINERIKAAERNYDYATKRQYEAHSALNELKKELNSTDESLRKRLTEMKPYVDAINGTFTPDEAAPVELSVATHDAKHNPELLVRQREIVNEMRRALAASGRPMEFWQVANLLISTQQSFITFFAGLPGVGKTSLARLLPEIQGIPTRLQEVAVARGWTSQKDLIGFYNPLSNRFQASSTGMYTFLRSLGNEKKGSQQAMAYALLDEANLSPIEHYWSCFMGMTDGGGRRTLALGGDAVPIPPNLRFLATINYDGTTEPLSPRIADRASIILIEPSEIVQRCPASDATHNPECLLPVSAQMMEELFGNEAPLPDLAPIEKDAFNKIRQVLINGDATQGHPVSISPRKELAISQYCAKARGIMGAENDALLALDVAVMQHVLPQVRGTGHQFGKRLENLRRQLEESGLPISSKFVSRMTQHGALELHTYDYFCW